MEPPGTRGCHWPTSPEGWPGCFLTPIPVGRGQQGQPRAHLHCWGGWRCHARPSPRSPRWPRPSPRGSGPPPGRPRLPPSLPGNLWEHRRGGEEGTARGKRCQGFFFPLRKSGCWEEMPHREGRESPAQPSLRCCISLGSPGRGGRVLAPGVPSLGHCRESAWCTQMWHHLSPKVTPETIPTPLYLSGDTDPLQGGHGGDTPQPCHPSGPSLWQLCPQPGGHSPAPLAHVAGAARRRGAGAAGPQPGTIRGSRRDHGGITGGSERGQPLCRPQLLAVTPGMYIYSSRTKSP